MKPEDSGGDFERWLDAELKRTLRSVQGPSPRAVQAGYRAASRPGGQLKNRVAALTATGISVFGAVAFAIGGGAMVATTTTGSANPAVWGQQLEAIVSDQVFERDTSPTLAPDPTASAGKHVRGERRTSNSSGSAPGHSGQSHENAGRPQDGRRHDDSRHDGKCDDRGGRNRPSLSLRH